jgi:hypothetical protein
VGVGVGEVVAVPVAVADGAPVDDAVAVAVSVEVGVAVPIAVADGAPVDDAVAVAVSVGLGVAVGVVVGVDVESGVRVTMGVSVGVGDAVAVGPAPPKTISSLGALGAYSLEDTRYSVLLLLTNNSRRPSFRVPSAQACAAAVMSSVTHTLSAFRGVEPTLAASASAGALAPGPSHGTFQVTDVSSHAFLSR